MHKVGAKSGGSVAINFIAMIRFCSECKTTPASRSKLVCVFNALFLILKI